MHAISYRSGFYFACRFKVNIYEPAFYSTITLLLTATELELPSCQIPTAMSDSQCLNTSLLQIMVSPKNKRVFIHNWNHLTLQITFDVSGASLNIGSKRLMAWNNSRYAHTRQFYLHYRIEETGSPSSICIICHQVLCYPFEHQTSSMGKHLLAKARIAKVNLLTELQVTKLTNSTVDETAVAILKRLGCRWIAIVGLQMKFIFDFSVLFILTDLTAKMLHTGSKGLWYCQISPSHLESLPHVRISFRSFSKKPYITSGATTIIKCITQRVGAAIHQQAEQHLPGGIHTDTGCNSKAIAIKKYSEFSFK